MQIFDYETKYLESCNPAGSALKGKQCMHQWHFGLWRAPLQCLCLATCKTLPGSVAELSAHCLQLQCREHVTVLLHSAASTGRAASSTQVASLWAAGYAGLLTPAGARPRNPNLKSRFQPQERVFSGSSLTGTVQASQQSGLQAPEAAPPQAPQMLYPQLIGQSSGFPPPSRVPSSTGLAVAMPVEAVL